MLYAHENNIRNKIATNYKGKAREIQEFYNTKYLPMRESVQELNFTENNLHDFQVATGLFNEYYDAIELFSDEHNIKSQSKFASTFLEELSVYLFKDLPLVMNGEYDFFNKGIYAGMKLDSDNELSIITKDVDFCIAKQVDITVDDAEPTMLRLPVVAVEVKTYLDATMFGEIKSSSKSIRSATPNSKAYVLMGYKDLADEHIVAARQDSTLTEMFALRADKHSPMDAGTIYEYWREIARAVESIGARAEIRTPGKLLHP